MSSSSLDDIVISVKVDDQFTLSISSWEANFADYPVGEETFYELLSGTTTLPSPLDETNGAFQLSGNNHSDDLFMYITKKITGLTPDQNYFVNYDLEIATNASDNSIGIGGSPATAVYLKAGAVNFAPDRNIDNLDFYRMNLDKSNQSQSGTDMEVIGDMSNGTDLFTYALVQHKNDTPIAVTANSSGEIWLILGTDSGFEGTTNIYFNYIKAEITANLIEPR